MARPKAGDVGVPIRPFLYTLDQIESLLEIKQYDLRRTHVHFNGRSVGMRPREKMLAINVADASDPPDWRISEAELVRWLRVKGFKVYERAWVVR
jgi:hypothetical protein